MLICGMHNNKDNNKENKDNSRLFGWLKCTKINTLTPTGIITPVMVNELIPRE
jgi:hypothetical protein